MNWEVVAFLLTNELLNFGESFLPPGPNERNNTYIHTWLVLTLAKLVYDGKLMFAKARGKKKPRK